MREEWKTTTLSEVCLIRPPKREAKYKLNGTDKVSFVPMDDLGIRQKLFNTYQKRPLDKVYGGYTYFADNDVLLAKITPCFQNGKLGIARDLSNGIGFGSSEFFVFRCSDQLIPEFLFYFLSQQRFTNNGVAQMSGAVGHQRVPLDFIEQHPIPLPPLPEQKRIVAILDEAFAAIAKATVNTEKNIANARELFESNLNAVFTCEKEGWVETKLSLICDVRDGTHDSPKYVDSGIPFITQKNIRKDGLDFANTNFICESDHARFYKRSNVSHGDILISMIGANRGMSCIVDDSRVFSIKNVGLIKAPDNVNMEFLLYYLKSRKAADYIEAVSRGGAQPFIGLMKLRDFPIYLTSKDAQDSFVRSLSKVKSQTAQLDSIYQKRLSSLSQLKQSILHKAFTGELNAKHNAVEHELSDANV